MDDASHAPPAVPDHTLLRVIGRGAYGEVWLARNIMNAWRAVKVVRRGKFAEARPYEREFEGIRKFEPVSRRHESQVDVLHVGRNDAGEYFYYVMELADDVERGQEIAAASYVPRTLRHDLDLRGRLAPAETVRLGIALATALDHLHVHGLIHRDVKPSNIIFVHGQPKLADLGLIAAQDDSLSLVGTCGYIPPEGQGTPSADVFSLGKVLYEAHTGRDRAQFPELPTRLESDANSEAAHDLNLVILKACAPDPGRRHAGAAALREELLLLQAGHSVRRLRRAERTARRARSVAWVAVFLAILGTLPYSKACRDLLARAWFRINGRALAVTVGDTYDLRPPPPPGTRAASRLGIYEACDRGEPAPVFLNRYGYEWKEPGPPEVCQHLDARDASGNGAGPWSLDFSPDSALVAVANAAGLRVFDTLSGERLAVLPLPNLLAVRFLPDGKSLLLQQPDHLLIAACDRPGVDRRWLRIGEFGEFSPGAPYAAALALDAERRTVALPGAMGDWWLWRLDEAGRPHRVLAGALAVPDAPPFAALSPRGEWLAASASRLSPPAVWSGADHRLVRAALHDADGAILSAAAFSSDGRWVADGSRNGLRVFSAESWREVRDLRIGTGNPFHHDPVAVFSPDSRFLAAGVIPGASWLFDTATWEMSVGFQAFADGNSSTAFSPDGRKLALLTNGGHILLFDLPAAGAAFARYGVKWNPPRPVPPPGNWSLAVMLRPESPTLDGMARRDPACAPGELDLGAFYNMSLNNRSPNWNSATESDGSEIQTGRREFGGVLFDARGIVQLAGGGYADKPLFVKGIPAGVRGRRVHFLHACGWAPVGGGQVGGYTIHYADGARADLPLIYEDNVLEWYRGPDDVLRAPQRAVVAWQGSSAYAERHGAINQLYRFTWENPHPDKVIAAIDYFSLQLHCAPLLVAITVEAAP